MRMPGRLTPPLILTLAMACTSSTGDDARPPDPGIAFTHVNVVPMDGERTLTDHTVIVHDGVIAAVGHSDALDVPAGAQTIDGSGAWLLPGLTDFHVHLRSTDELLSYLAHGVTTIVHLSGAMGGAPDVLAYRDQLANGQRPGPTLYTTGPILDGDPPIFGGVSVVVTSPEEASRVVAGQKQDGYDFIKVYNNLRPEVLLAVTESARQQGMAVIGHIPRIAGRADALQRALAAGQDVIAHGEEYFFTYFYAGVDSLLDLGRVPFVDDRAIPDAVRMTRAAETAVIPNLSFVAMTRRQLDDLVSVFSDPEMSYLPVGVLEMWQDQTPGRRADRDRFDRREVAKYAFLKNLTLALRDGGVPLLLGTDASAPGVFPGRSAHLELSELVAAGLTPYEAIAAGTRAAGVFIGRHVPSVIPFGLVAPGYRADLILVRANPLDDVGNLAMIEGVMARGAWFSIDELRAKRDSIVASRLR